jgi:hypothetical protein
MSGSGEGFGDLDDDCMCDDDEICDGGASNLFMVYFFRISLFFTLFRIKLKDMVGCVFYMELFYFPFFLKILFKFSFLFLFDFSVKLYSHISSSSSTSASNTFTR